VASFLVDVATRSGEKSWDTDLLGEEDGKAFDGYGVSKRKSGIIIGVSLPKTKTVDGPF